MGLDIMLRDGRSPPLEFDRYPFFNKDPKTRSHCHESHRASPLPAQQLFIPFILLILYIHVPSCNQPV